MTHTKDAVNIAVSAVTSAMHEFKRAHKHADLIKAWADGAEIEYRSADGVWVVLSKPTWQVNANYRIKQAPPDPLQLVTAERDALKAKLEVLQENAHEDNALRVRYAALLAPMTNEEIEDALRRHLLPTTSPSQRADAFRAGIKYREMYRRRATRSQP